MSFSGERKGSALLIVLGLLAFLIVSAVSFSIYMRQSRLPSSYLRRTAASRQLAKAALVRAIDQIDEYIGSDPHPNVGGGAHNVWRGRVLMGTNMVVSVEETVPTLTLEGLAYIPPPLVNAARYYSRLTPTAKWQHFGYDTGRYAFSAIDVSDYFDVNRMFADKGRSSAANRRISLAYLFEDGADHSSAPTKATEWDEFMKRFREVDDESLAISYDGKFPLISVCDMNLAMGKSGIAGLKSYFCEYIGAQGSRAGFYDTRSEDDEERVERMTFVTDSLPSGRKSTSLAAGAEAQRPLADLAIADNQPFKMADLERENASAYKVMLGELCQTKNVKPHDAEGNAVTDSSGRDFLWQNYLSGLGLAALWDYLDTDQYPISLAVPTTERHAMICGIEPMLKNDPGISVIREISHEPAGPVPNAQPGDKLEQYETTVTYYLSFKNLIDRASLVKALTVYPFSHADELEAEDMSFKVDGVFKFFFSREKMSLRTGTGDKLHPDASSFTMPTAINPELGQIAIGLAPSGVPVSFDAGEVKEEKDALRLVSGSGGTSILSLGNALTLETEFKGSQNFLLQLTYNWMKPGNAGDTEQYFKDNIMKNPGAVNKLGQPNLTSAKTPWRPVDSSGKPVDDGLDDDALLSKLRGGYSASPATFYFNAAIWLRVTADDNSYPPTVVDMVPACFEDDSQSGGGSSGGASAQLMSEIGKEICGRTYPLFRFDTNGGKGDSIEFAFSVERLDEMSEAPKTVKLYPESAIVADPRWNFAPEYWYSLGGTLSEDAWLQNCHRDQGDGDIFMATSDQGYLQSIYELAFLPRFKNLTSSGDAKLIGSLSSLNSAQSEGIAQSFSDTPNNKFMWRMFDPMDEDETAFDDLPFATVGHGMRVNPYSDSTNVIMAAFANTPAGWRVASTNNEEDIGNKTAAEFNKEYAYCAYADDESRKVKWNDLKALAGRFMDKIRASTSGAAAYDWSKVWNDLDWFGDEKELWGVSFSSQNTCFWGVDKRFLYGYWRDCFAAEQQLFLVFVRAEPLMMGGGAINQIPPQLGARAVALVWRDPKAPKDASAPHRTRVLFYRQFE